MAPADIDVALTAHEKKLLLAAASMIVDVPDVSSKLLPPSDSPYDTLLQVTQST